MRLLFSFLLFTFYFASTAQIPSYVPTNGLVGWWPFNGNANDESGNGNNGVVNGATLTSDRFGVANACYYYSNSSNQFIDYGNINVLNTSNSFSFSAWFNYSQIPSFPNDWFTVLSDGSYSDPNGFGIIINQNMLLFRNNSSFGVLTTFALNLNTWYNVVGVYSSDSVKLFLNGNLIGSNSHQNTNLLNTGYSFKSGKCDNLPIDANDHEYYFNGKIDDIALFNRALTQTEITNLYNASLPVPCPTLPANLQTGLVGYWPFCGNANDESGNGNNGVVNGATLTSDRFGNEGKAYYFSASEQDYIVSSQIGMNSLTGTFSAWVEFDGPIGGGNPYTALDWYTIVQPVLLNANANSSNYKKLIVNYNNQPISTSNVSFNNWHQITVSIDLNGQTTFYIDGVFSGSQTITNSYNLFSATSFFFFGKSENDAWYFNGKIDDIAIYNRALTPQEITQLYTNTITPATSEDTTSNVGIGTTTPKRKLHVNDVMRLEPRDTAPANPAKGDIYFDGVLNKLRVYDGSVWQSCW